MGRWHAYRVDQAGSKFMTDWDERVNPTETKRLKEESEDAESKAGRTWLQKA